MRAGADAQRVQLALSDGRAVRMIQALLAAADPLDRMVEEVDASCYAPLAAVVFTALRNGADSRRVMLLVCEHAAAAGRGESAMLGSANAFAEAATDWWGSAQSRWLDPVAI